MRLKEGERSEAPGEYSSNRSREIFTHSCKQGGRSKSARKGPIFRGGQEGRL